MWLAKEGALNRLRMVSVCWLVQGSWFLGQDLHAVVLQTGPRPPAEGKVLPGLCKVAVDA